jgi:hypothetical protein
LTAIKKFIELAKRRPFVVLYALAVFTGLALLVRFIPVVDIAMGFASLSNSSPLDSAVSLARWIAAPDTLLVSLLAMLGVSLFVAMLAALLFAGAIGAFARGVADVCGFQSDGGTGFWSGYQKRFMNVMALFFVTLSGLLLMAFIWLVASIPLAIVNEMSERGDLGRNVYNFVVIFTAFIVYSGLLIFRLYSLACLPTLFSGSEKPIRGAFSFAGRNFFAIARYFVAADVTQAFLFSLYGFFQKNIVLFYFNCAFTTAVVLFLAFIPFFFYTRDSVGHAVGAAGEDGGEANWDGFDGDRGEGEREGGERYDEDSTLISEASGIAAGAASASAAGSNASALAKAAPRAGAAARSRQRAENGSGHAGEAASRAAPALGTRGGAGGKPAARSNADIAPDIGSGGEIGEIYNMDDAEDGFVSVRGRAQSGGAERMRAAQRGPGGASPGHGQRSSGGASSGYGQRGSGGAAPSPGLGWDDEAPRIGARQLNTGGAEEAGARTGAWQRRGGGIGQQRDGGIGQQRDARAWNMDEGDLSALGAARARRGGDAPPPDSRAGRAGSVQNRPGAAARREDDGAYARGESDIENLAEKIESLRSRQARTSKLPPPENSAARRLSGATKSGSEIKRRRES